MVEDCQKFLKIMKNLKLYLIKFEEDRSMKTKNYLDNCTIGNNICQLVIIITYDKYIFFINNEIQKIWTYV